MMTEPSRDQAKRDALAALRKRKAQLEERIKQAEQKAAGQRRKADTRLKVLLGAALLADLPHNPANNEVVRKMVARGNWQKNDADFLIAAGWLDASYKVQTPKRSETKTR